VTWSVQESLGGSVNQNGLYTAPNRVGTFHVRATSVADPSKSDNSSIDVESEPEPKLAAEKTTDVESEPKLAAEKTADVFRATSPSTAESAPRQRSRRSGQAPQPRTPRRRPRAEQQAFIRPEERPEVES
jgi:hypothetical protein